MEIDNLLLWESGQFGLKGLPALWLARVSRGSLPRGGEKA